jgi:hypothetical protein
VVTHHYSAHAALLVQEVLDPSSLQNVGASCAGRGKQLVIEDSTRDRETGRAKWTVTSQGKLSVRRGSPGPGDFHSFQRKGTRRLEVFHDSEPRQDAHSFRAHVLGAGLVPGKRGAIYYQNG